MATGRFRDCKPWLALMASALATLVGGCAQPGPLASRKTTLGTLKTSVSRLEYENETLKTQVGELKAENARFDSELAQEREANGDLTARLDDARDLVRRQGGDVTALGTPPRPNPVEDDGIPPPIAFPPARRSSSKTRKPPAASIPRPDPADPDTTYDTGPRTRDLGPRSQIDDDRWLPVARGMGTPVRY